MPTPLQKGMSIRFAQHMTISILVEFFERDLLGRRERTCAILFQELGVSFVLCCTPNTLCDMAKRLVVEFLQSM